MQNSHGWENDTGNPHFFSSVVQSFNKPPDLKDFRLENSVLVRFFEFLFGTLWHVSENWFESKSSLFHIKFSPRNFREFSPKSRCQEAKKKTTGRHNPPNNDQELWSIPPPPHSPTHTTSRKSNRILCPLYFSYRYCFCTVKKVRKRMLLIG